MNDSEFSIISLILDASLVVKFIMLLLLVASLWSWAVIFMKLSVFRQYRREARMFEDRFRVGTDLGRLYQSITHAQSDVFGMKNIFTAGLREYFRLKRQGIDRNGVLDGVNRSMRVVVNKEIDALESWLSFLATVGSTTPYIGLFGTVWGIMDAFQSLGKVGNATLAMVAPGISEALVATAMGLFAAIPGVIFYNRFATESQRLYSKYETFSEELSTILQHQDMG
jgi:biopolymer transport protein TolQ